MNAELKNIITRHLKVQNICIISKLENEINTATSLKIDLT